MRVAVTGSATGIGAEACRLLKERGDEVIGFDVAETPANVDRFYKVDLSDPAAIETVLARVEGRFDALLNIAGVPPRPGNEVLVLSVNFIGLRAFTLGLMDKLNDSASIVSMSSRAGMAWRDNIDQVKALMGLTPNASIEEFCRHHEINHVRAYNLSKEAVIVWSIAQTEPLVSRNIRLNTVSPSGVETKILDDFKDAFGRERVEQNTKRVGRLVNPDEAAQAAIFLASPDSSWIKGIDLGIDGGAVAMNISDALGLKEFASLV